MRQICLKNDCRSLYTESGRFTKWRPTEETVIYSEICFAKLYSYIKPDFYWLYKTVLNIKHSLWSVERENKDKPSVFFS